MLKYIVNLDLTPLSQIQILLFKRTKTFKEGGGKSFVSAGTYPGRSSLGPATPHVAPALSLLLLANSVFENALAPCGAGAVRPDPKMV